VITIILDICLSVDYKTVWCIADVYWDDLYRL